MSKNRDGLFASLLTENAIFLNYLKAKFPVFHNSNIFYRDLEGGLRSYFEKKGTRLKNIEAEALTKKYVEHLESESVLIKTSSQGWKINYPEFVTTKPGDPF